MHLILIVRKLVKVLHPRNYNSNYKRERQASLHDYLEAGKEHKRGSRRYVIVFLIAPAIYYMFSGTTLNDPSIFEAEVKKLIRNQSTDSPQGMAVASPELTTKKAYVVKKRKPKQKKVVKVICTTDIQFAPFTPRHTIDFLKISFPEVNMGGFYTPKNCTPQHKVAVIVPYRNRGHNLPIFLYNIHKFMIMQNVEYGIYLVEQAGHYPFNKGRVFNAGVKEILKLIKWQCIIFHDVDLLPLNLAILYTCPNFPRHMCTVIRNRKYKPLNHKLLFGGVTAMSVHHYERVNGYSNLYWGWGGEDNDMFWRIRSLGYPLMRYNKQVGQYIELPHEDQPPNEYRYQVLEASLDRYKVDGLTNVEYTLLGIRSYRLYTHISVDVNPKRENVTYFYQKYFESLNKTTYLVK